MGMTTFVAIGLVAATLLGVALVSQPQSTGQDFDTHTSTLPPEPSVAQTDASPGNETTDPAPPEPEVIVRKRTGQGIVYAGVLTHQASDHAIPIVCNSGALHRLEIRIEWEPFTSTNENLRLQRWAETDGSSSGYEGDIAQGPSPLVFVTDDPWTGEYFFRAVGPTEGIVVNQEYTQTVTEWVEVSADQTADKSCG